MHVVVEVQSTLVLVVDPNSKLVAVLPRAKPAPVTVTLVAPAVEPVLGSSLVTVGLNVKRSTHDMTVVAYGVVTLTFTGRAASGGETAVIDVAEVTLKLAAPTEPNSTAVAPVRLVPVMVTVLPPDAGPYLRSISVMVGAGMVGAGGP